METIDTSEQRKRLVRELLEQAQTLAADYGDEVEAAVKAAIEEPLDAERARRLYTRIITLIRSADGAPESELAGAVRREVDEIVAAVARPASGDGAELELVPLNGLTPHEVHPVPVFNGQYISMWEGYVDVEKLDLWPENHRIELNVAEFRELNGRDPDRGELIELMHGNIHLPSLDKKDPFKLLSLSRSIARKGVERPPIVSYNGLPKDGNRRIAASLLVLDRDEFTAEEKERARWIRVWRAPEGTTDDQFDAIVVALNFEDDHKEEWPEYVKARLVVRRYEMLRDHAKGRFGEAKARELQKEVAKHFAITPQEVRRYMKMVQWAEDFEAYHIAADRQQSKVAYRTNDIFQYFYELDAGTADEKLTRKLDADDDLKSLVYDLMFDVLDSGAQVRALHKVVGDSDALEVLAKAHDVMETDTDEALELVKEAIELGKRKSIKRRRVGFDQFLKTVVERLGATPPDQWSYVDTELLLEVRRVFAATNGSISAALDVRAAHGEDIDE
jgi:hypothetical protein